MSLGKRFVRLVRSNLNALIDRTADWQGDDGDRRIEDLTDEELEAELRRRKQRREAAHRAADSATGPSYEQQAWDEVDQAVRGSGRFRHAGQRPRRPSQRYDATGRHRTGAARDPHMARLYAQLECPYGADMTAVRKQYRAMMRKYHPDMHSSSPDKQRLATELSQKLTSAYNELRRSV